MGYPSSSDFREARTHRAPPKNAEQLKEARERGTNAHEEHAAKTAAAINALKFSDLRAVNVTRMKRWHGPDSVPWMSSDWSNALCGEAGELANVVKKVRRHETGARNEGDPSVEELTAMVGAELADVVIYADLVAHHFGLDLAAAVKEKFNRVSKKYGFPERLGP